MFFFHSHDGKFIVAGSENQCIYIWKTYHDYSRFSSARRDRNGYWEGVKGKFILWSINYFDLVKNFVKFYIDCLIYIFFIKIMNMNWKVNVIFL